MSKSKTEGRKVSGSLPSALPSSQTASPPRSIAPSFEKTSPMFGSSACKYARMSSEAFRGAESMNLSVGKTLGSGTYAKVKAVWSNSAKQLMALKIVNKRVASPDYLSKFLPREIELLRVISHPYIIAAHSIVETEHQVFFLMDLAENGDLLDYINARRHLPEHEARYLFSQITEGIQFLHSHNIAHRDLKCENILLGHNMNIKIADFGFGIDVSFSPAKTPCGSYSYAAPELFIRTTEHYDAKKADIWSMGVILYAMVCGRLVFGDDSTVKRTQNRQVHFPSNIPLTEALKDVILSMLKKECVSRLPCHEVSKHVWLTSGIAVKPAPPVKFSVKYTKDNLGIQYRTEAMDTGGLPAISQQSQPLGSAFLSKLTSRISSAVKPRRNSPE